MVHQLPQLRQMLHQWRDDLLRRADVGERVGDDEGLQPGERLERHLCDVFLVELLDIDPAHVGERHGGSAELGRVGDCKIHLVLGRHPAFEGDAVGLGHGVSVPMLREIETLLFRQRGFQIGRLADQAGFALLAHAALEQRLDEDELVPVEQILDLIFGRAWSEHFRGRKFHMRQQARPKEHAGDVHGSLLDPALGAALPGDGEGRLAAAYARIFGSGIGA